MNKIVNINVPLKRIFSNYLLLTKPFHKLTDREISVLSLLLFYNYLETPNFKKESDRWNKVFHYDTKLKIREELGMEDYALQNTLSTLRKKKAIVDNTIPKGFIPVFDEKDSFKLIYNFKVNG